jgi:pimeloyl-ACP methyl ester carboxylesterase
MRADRITARDGAGIVVYSVGTGPGIVILHGGGVMERDYRRLARALSDRFTVHLYNRRGRPDSAPLTGTETVETDLGDLAAVLEHTGARNVFGHSGGGFVALQAGLSLSLDRIAVYDPGVAIPGCGVNTTFVEPFEEAVRAGDYARALTLMSRDVYPDDLSSKLPFGVQQRIGRAFLRTPIGRRIGDLLPTVPPEVRRIAAHEGPATDYAGITADALLASGSRSPRHFARVCEALAGALPRARAIVIPGSPHNAANVARKRFVQPFANFFAGSLAPV